MERQLSKWVGKVPFAGDAIALMTTASPIGGCCPTSRLLTLEPVALSRAHALSREIPSKMGRGTSRCLSQICEKTDLAVSLLKANTPQGVSSWNHRVTATVTLLPSLPREETPCGVSDIEGDTPRGLSFLLRSCPYDCVSMPCTWLSFDIEEELPSRQLFSSRLTSRLVF
jgi:hypothetical protein